MRICVDNYRKKKKMLGRFGQGQLLVGCPSIRKFNIIVIRCHSKDQ